MRSEDYYKLLLQNKIFSVLKRLFLLLDRKKFFYDKHIQDECFER